MTDPGDDYAEAALAASGSACIAWLTYRDDVGGMLYATVAARHGDWEPWVADGKDLPEPASARVIYDPPIARRRIAAMRAILERHMPVPGHGGCVRCGDDPGPGCGDTRALAAIWDGHPDYSPEWKP